MILREFRVEMSNRYASIDLRENSDGERLLTVINIPEADLPDFNVMNEALDKLKEATK